jgi:ParB/RepB/Spo0J family partition protein
MAVEFKVDHTRTSEYLFATKDIKFKPELNGRHELPEIEELINSMVKVGQLQPVLIRNDGGTPVLVAGFSRWRAAVEINKRELTPAPFKLRCVYFKGSEQQAVLANIAENRERNSTTPIDDGYNIARLERYGMSMEDIASYYHEDTQWCRKRLALISLTPEAQKAVKEGKVKPNAVQALAKMSEDQQHEALKSSTAVTTATLKSITKPVPDQKKSPKSSIKELLVAIVERGELPTGLDIAKMAPADAVHAVCGILLDLVNGVKSKAAEDAHAA